LNPDDEDIPNDVESPPIARDYDSRYSEQESNVYKGPMTRARMRHLQHEVNSLLIDYEHASTKNYLLLNNGALIVLRFEEDAMQVYVTQRPKKDNLKTASCCFIF
jgi:hypothetical protein